MFSLGGRFPPSSLATAKAKYSACNTPPSSRYLRDYHPLQCGFPANFSYVWIGSQTLQAHPTSLLHCCSDSVWTMPLSLAATYGISIDFFSSCYSDVSVRKGSRSPKGTGEAPKGFSYEVAFGNPRINRCLLLPEAYRSLPRPSSSSKPSHPPYSVSASDGYISTNAYATCARRSSQARTFACYVLQSAFTCRSAYFVSLCFALISQKANRFPI